MVKPASGCSPPRLRRPPPLDFCSSDRFKGVRRRSWGRWVSEIRIPHTRDKIWLGSYGTAEQAARAYDIASLLLRGPSCCAFLNFPDSNSLVHSAEPRLASLAAAGIPPSPHTIQVAAAAAAAAAAVSACSQPTDASAVTSDSSAARLPGRVSSVPQSCCTASSSGRSDNSSTTPHACWIQDVIALILSPKEKNSPVQNSPTMSKCPAAPMGPLQPGSVCNHISHCISSRPECLLHAMLDDFQCPLEGLGRYGFTAISAAVTTHKPFDTETTGPAHDVDASTQLWNYVC